MNHGRLIFPLVVPQPRNMTEGAKGGRNMAEDAGAEDGKDAREPAACYKLVDQRRFDRIEQVLKSVAMGGIVVAVCSFLEAVSIILEMSGASTPGTGMNAALAVLCAIVGLTIWTGALRVKELIQAAGEISADTEGLSRVLAGAAKVLSTKGLSAKSAKEKKTE